MAAADGRAFTLLTRRVEGWTYQVGINRSEDGAFVRLVYGRFATVGLPILGLFVVGGYLLGRAGLRPLRRLAAEMQAVSADHPGQGVRLDRLPRELAAVGESFNAVAARLASAIDRRDAFAADVAHELRTPVHNLRTAAELALHANNSPESYRAALSEVVDEADRLGRLIDRLLLLARLADPRAGLAREGADLAAELDTVREFFAPAAEEAGVALDVTAPPTVPFEVDRALFGRAISNLVANALAHTPSGGRITVAARPTPEGVAVEVSDTGCGIPADALPRLFDRFYRVGGGGLGLGLAIVRRVAELHGGTVAVESHEGRGTAVRLALPARENDTAVTSVSSG